MSYSTFFGAIAVPREIADVYHYTDTTAPQMFGSSRSGWFHGVCEQLIDALPGHDALQFLAGKIWTREVQEDSGRTVWTVLGEGAIIGVSSAIDALLGACKQQPRVFIDRVFGSYGNLSEAEVLVAIRDARTSRHLNQSSTYAEDGDSLEFFFSALVTLKAILHQAREKSSIVLYFSWFPS